jgi:hypothetical protein
MTYETYQIEPIEGIDLSNYRVLDEAGLLTAKEILQKTNETLEFQQQALDTNNVYMEAVKEEIERLMADLLQIQGYQQQGENNIATLRKQVAQVEQVIHDFETEI